ncbi:MAG: triose-phosphate isomerase [Planctomycetales bacterium]
MRRQFIAGNWKMNTTRQEAVDLASGVAQGLADVDGVDVGVCPPSVYLSAVSEVVKDSSVALGAQNMSDQSKGAYTGEISAAMLLDVGCQCVILGHSERRHGMGETDEQVNKKALAALAAGLQPIICVGELLEEREAGNTEKVIQTQIQGSLAGLSTEQAAKIVIAYEPVWAIGTGKVATPDQAEAVHLHIRNLLETAFGDAVAQGIRIQYGGCVKPSNAAELLAQPNIDGALVGGASLKADDFLGIIKAAPKA